MFSKKKNKKLFVSLEDFEKYKSEHEYAKKLIVDKLITENEKLRKDIEFLLTPVHEYDQLKMNTYKILNDNTKLRLKFICEILDWESLGNQMAKAHFNMSKN